MNLKTNYQRVRAEVSRQSIDSEVIDEVLNRLDWVYDDISAVIESDYDSWIKTYVRQRAHSADNKKELCGCPAKRCPLKQGILPYLEETDDINEYIAGHRNPIVLIEAKKEWESKKKRLSYVLDRCHVALQRQDISILPDKEDLDL